MRFGDFSFISIWFSVFVKNTSGFSILVPSVVFGFSLFFFPIWTYLGIQFCMRFSVLTDFVCGFAVLDEYFFGFAVSSIPQCPPRNWQNLNAERMHIFHSDVDLVDRKRLDSILNSFLP